MGVRNRFKGLDLINKVPDELWMKVHDNVQETGIKTIHRKTNAKRQNSCLRRPYKQPREEEKLKAKEKRKVYSFECRIPKNSKERSESLPK